MCIELKKIMLKCSTFDTYRNGCNPKIFHLWQAKYEVQYVLDAKSTVNYMCTYITEIKKAMGELLKYVAEDSQEHILQKLKKILSAFIC